jgi:hypothetical protein
MSRIFRGARRPRLRKGRWYDEVRGSNPLTDLNLSEAEVLRLLGSERAR